MADFITLSCPSCGGRLEITKDVERFACAHCGSEQIVRRGGGIVSLAPVVAGLKQVQIGVDKTASELAIKRLQEELSSLQAQRQRAISELPARLLSVTAELKKKVAALDSIRSAAKRWPQLAVLSIMLLAGVAGLVVFCIGTTQTSGAYLLRAAVALICELVAAIFGCFLVILGRQDSQAVLQLSQARLHADEEMYRIRIEVDENTRAFDAKILKTQQEFERHRQIVSQ